MTSGGQSVNVRTCCQGFGPALNAMGYYEVNTRQNYSGGTVYFRMAAEKGDRDGFFNLGVAYDNGWVPKEEKNKVGRTLPPSPSALPSPSSSAAPLPLPPLTPPSPLAVIDGKVK